MPDPVLALVLLTYGGSAARREYAYTTLHSTLDNLRFSGPIHVHIADDGSPAEHRSVLTEIAGGYANVSRITVSNSERGGYGRNYNLATQELHQVVDIALVLEDDWTLTRELALDPIVEALADERIGCVRMGYLGFTRPELRGRAVHLAGGTYFLIDSDNEEPHIFAGHPRLETVEWERSVGPWPEGLPPGTTEFEVCHLPAARASVAWPMHMIPSEGGLFAHVGSVPSTQEDSVAAMG